MSEDILNRIWKNLTKNKLTKSDFETWKSNIESDQKVQENVHQYLVEKKLTDSDFTTWQSNSGLKKKEEIVTESISEDGSSGFAEGEVEEFVGDVKIPQDGLESTPFGVKRKVDGELTSISPTTEAMMPEVTFPQKTEETLEEKAASKLEPSQDALFVSTLETQEPTVKEIEKDISPLIDNQTIERLSGDLDPEVEKETRKFYEDRGIDYDEVRALELRYDELLNKKLAAEEVNEIINNYSQTMTGTGLEITEDERLLEIKEKYPQFFNSQGLPSFTDFSELEQKEFDKISKLIVDSKGNEVRTRYTDQGVPVKSFAEDQSNQRLREDLDEYLVSKRKERSSQAAVYNEEAKAVIKKVDEESVRVFGKDLSSVLSESEKGQRVISEEDSAILNRLIKEFNSSISTSDLAAKEYAKSMLYYNRQHNKSLNGEYEDGYKATLNAIKGGAKMGNSIVGLFSVMLDTPGSSKEEVIKKMAENFEEQSKLPTSRLMTRFQQSKSATELKTAVLNNPIGYMASFMGESLAMMLPAGVRFGVANTLAQVGIGAARAGAPGATAGLATGIISSFSAANGIVEYGNAFFEAAGEKGYDLSNPDDMLNAMQDEEVWDKANRVGIPRAIAISGVDLAGGTLMSKALKGLKYSTISRGRLVGTALGSQVIIGPTQEGGGELLAQAVAGEGFSLQETVAEMIGGAGTNIPNIGLDVYGIATGKVNNKLAEDLKSTRFMASELENMSGEKIQSWVYNMRRLGKMTPEQESEILDNLSSVKEIKELVDNKAEFKDMKSKERIEYISVLSVLKQELKSLKEESEVLGVSIDAEKKKSLEDKIKKLVNKEITPKSVLQEKIKESLTFKEESDAIQESSTESVDVQEQAGASEGVREGDITERVAPTESTTQDGQEQDVETQVEEIAQEEIIEPSLSPQEIEAQELEDLKKEIGQPTEEVQEEENNLEGNLFLKGSDPQLSITQRNKRTGLIKRGKSAIRSIKKILPNTKIILHKNNESYILAAGRKGKGEFVPKTNTIHINLSKATGSTIAHEVFHAVFIDKVKGSKDLQKTAADMVKSIGKSLPKDSDLAKKVKNFSDRYESGIQDEEFLAELVGLLSSEEFGFSELPKPAKNTIIEFLKKIAKKIGIKLEATFGKTDESVIDLINILTRKVSTGEEIVAEDVQSLEQEEKDSKSEITNRQQKEALDIIGVETPKKNATKIVVADILNGFAKSELTPNSSEQDLISRFLENIFEESLYTLNKGSRESGMTWYMEDITEFENKMKVLLPELEDPNQMKLFKQVLAITSSGTNPNQNLKTAYTLWVRSNGDAVNFAKNWGKDKISFITKKGVPLGTGVVVRETKTKYVLQKVDALGNLETFKNGTPKLFEAKKSQLKKGYPKPAGFTSRGSIVAQQLIKIEKVYKSVGKDINKLISFFEETQPVSELRKYNKGIPDADGNTRIIAVGKRNGAFIFGEKIGAFYQNMIGIGDTITMDLWWSRTWNRYMGTMLSTVKGERNIQETPRTDRERDIMRKAVTLAADKLNLSVSELQAVIWYFEQELWTKAGKVSPSFSYVTAVNKLNNEIETDEETKRRFSKAGADLTKAEERRQDAVSRADNIVNEASGEGVVANRQEISPRQQLEEIVGDTENSLFQTIAQARFAGFKDITIKALLKEQKYSVADINEAMKVEKIVSLSFPSILSRAFYKSKFHTTKSAKDRIKQILDLEIGRSVELPSSFANVKGGVISGKRLLVDIMTEVTEKAILKRNSYRKIFETKEKRLSNAQVKKLSAESSKERAEVRKIAIETLEKNSDYKNESEEMQAQMKLDLDRIISGEVGTYGSKMFIENFRVLRTMLSERAKGRAGIKEMQMMLRSFIRQNLPSIDYSKPEVSRLLKAITDVKIDPKSRSTNIDEITARVVGYVSEAQSSQVESKINKLLSTTTQRTESGRIKGKGFLPSFQDSFAELERMIVDDNMAEQKIQDTIGAQRREFEDIMSRTQERTVNEIQTPAEELSQEDLDRLEILQIAIELNSAKMMENKDPLKVKALSNVLVLLQKYILRGKSENKGELNAYKQRVNNMIAEAFYNVSGGQNIPETEEERARWVRRSANKAQRRNDSRNLFLSAFKTAFTGLEGYFTKSNALEGLVSKVTMIPGEMIGGRFQDMITYRVKDSTSEFTRRKLLVTKMIDDNAKRIFGKDYISKMEKNKAGINTGLYVNSQEAKDIKLKISKEKNEAKKRKLISKLGELEIEASKNQIYYLYNQYKDPANIPTFNAMYGEDYAKTMEGLINFLDDETKAWADWQVNVFFPSLYNDYNDVYKRIYRANMPWNQFYAGRLYREVNKKDAGVDLLKSQTQYMGSVGGQSTKERVKNKERILKVDGDKALSVYVNDMEYFRAYAETLKEINTVFNNKYVRLSIEENTGKETYKLITDMINKLSTRGIKSGEIQLLNKLNSAFVSAKLGINPTVFVKQLTSAFAFADYVGIRNWIKYWVKAAPDAKQLWNEWYDNSPVLQARYEFSSIANVLEGYDYDTINDKIQSPVFEALSITKDEISKAQNALMYLVKMGDMGGIMGGISNYLYYKEKFAEKNPKATEQQAIDYASRKATNEATSTQQNSAIEDKDWWQTAGQLPRLMSLFLSAPKALNRKTIMSVRQLYRKSATLGKAMREGKSFKEANEIARNTGRGSAYENWRRMAIYHSAIPTVFQYVALGMPGLLTDFDDDDLEELGIAAILGNINAVFLVGDLFVAAKDLYLNKFWAGRMKNLSAFMAIEEIATRSIIPLVNSSSPEKTKKYTMRLILQLLELGGIPAKNVKKLAENYYKLLTGDVEDTGEAVARLLNYSDYVIEK